MQISLEEFDGQDILSSSSPIFLEELPNVLVSPNEIIATPRINVGYAKDWARFVERNIYLI